MFTRLLAGCAVALAIGGAPAALAQDTSTTTGAGADTTCTDFIAMEADAQASLISQLQADSNAGATSGTAGTATSGTVDASKVEPVVTACQNNGSLTVGQAIAQTPATGD
jgi:hypothetical protein